jgi:predicted phosphoribosyltransferase
MLSQSSQFADRRAAGARLVPLLSAYAGRPDVLVFGLPRGGVPVASEVAHGLQAPLDVFVVRKLGVPGHEELAMGAVASGGVRVLNEEVLVATRTGADEIAYVTARELEVLGRQEHAFRGDRPLPDLAARTVILTDDGLATGATMRAAIAAVRERGAAGVIVAVPVAPRETLRALRAEVDEIVCLLAPDPFVAVGVWYRDFRPVSDNEVRELLVGDQEP